MLKIFFNHARAKHALQYEAENGQTEEHDDREELKHKLQSGDK